MSNSFNSNSRFAVLADEVKDVKKKNEKNEKNEKKKLNKDNNNLHDSEFFNKETDKKLKILETNSFKSDGNSFKRDSNSFKNSNPISSYEKNPLTNKLSKEQVEKIALDNKIRKEKEEILRKEEVAKALSITNFPELNIDIDNDDNKIEKMQENNYLRKIKESEQAEKEEILKNEEKLRLGPKAGWIYLYNNNSANVSISNYNNLVEKIVQPEEEDTMDTLNALCELHEKRTNNYIEMYDYYTWEKIFKFPGWEEEEAYYDKLDEDYEQYYIDSDEEYTTDIDKYWEHY
jgi:hypothetical protein